MLIFIKRVVPIQYNFFDSENPMTQNLRVLDEISATSGVSQQNVLCVSLRSTKC